MCTSSWLRFPCERTSAGAFRACFPGSERKSRSGTGGRMSAGAGPQGERVMLGSIGMPELMVIFVIALVVFGPRRLPEIGRSLGRTIAEFKRASSELRDTFEREVELDAEAAAKRSEFSEQLSRSASGDLS